MNLAWNNSLELLLADIIFRINLFAIPIIIRVAKLKKLFDEPDDKP
jgi:hypothetical protein